MEEKTNRIAEVIISSVKPFQLMLGKIIGIGLVALTQFFLWIAFIFIIYNVTKPPEGATRYHELVIVGGVQESFHQYQCSTDLVLLYFLSAGRIFLLFLLICSYWQRGK